MQKQTQRLFTAFLPKGCSHLLKAQSAAVSEIYLLYFCPKKEYLSLCLPIHPLLMYHSTTNSYNQHWINTTFPPGRTQLALYFLIITHPQGKTPSKLSPALTDQLFPSALHCHSHSPSSAELCAGSRLLFLSHCPPTARQDSFPGTPSWTQQSALAQLWLRAWASLCSVFSQCPAEQGALGWPSRGPFPVLCLCNVHDSLIWSRPWHGTSGSVFDFLLPLSSCQVSFGIFCLNLILLKLM